MNSGMYLVLAFVAGQQHATLVPVLLKSGKAASHGSSGQRQRHYLQEVRQVQPPSRLEEGLRVFHVSAYVRYPGAWAPRPDAALLVQRQADRGVVQGQAAPPPRAAWTTAAARSSRGRRRRRR